MTKKPPHAVDDGGNRRQQLDRRSHWPAQPCRRQLGQVEGDAEGQRYRQDQRQHGGDQRAIDRHAGTEYLLDRIPVGAGDEADAEPAKRRQSADEQRYDYAAQQHQHEPAGCARGSGEHCIAHVAPRTASNSWRGADGDRLLHAGQRAAVFTCDAQAARMSAFTASGSGIYRSCVAISFPLANPQPKNLSTAAV